MMPRKQSLWKTMTSLSQTSHQPGVHPERTVQNVFDDAVWGTDWTDDRRAAAALLKQQKGQEHRTDEAMVAAERAEQARKQKRIEANPAGPFSWPRQNMAGRRYHIAPDGRALPCRADVRACPYDATDHFGIETNSTLNAQRVADWIVERRNHAALSTSNVNVAGGEAENPRKVEETFQGLNDRRGARANTIEFEATLTPTNAAHAITLTRRIGNTFDNRWADHAYWELNDGIQHHDVLVADAINDALIEDFIDRYMAIEGQGMEQEEQYEIKVELESQIRNLIMVSEGEASLGQRVSAHYSTVPLDLKMDVKIEEEISGSLDYANTGLSPAHFSMLENAHGKTQLHIAEGFEVRDEEAGEGEAGWRAVKTHEGWKVTVRGTRGDVSLFTTTDAGRAGRLLEDRLVGRVKKAEPAGRGEFVKSLIEEDHRRGSLESNVPLSESLLDRTLDLFS